VNCFELETGAPHKKINMGWVVVAFLVLEAAAIVLVSVAAAYHD
jgi:hypothetical protein